MRKLKISKVSIRTGRIPSVRVTQGIVTNRKKKATKGLDHYLLYPDVDVADLARPSMRYRAGLRALGEIAEMNVSPTRSFENMLDQFDRKCDVMLDQKAQAGIDAGQFTGSKRQLDLLEADFIKKEKRRRIELEVQAEVEGLAELSSEKVEAFIATNVLNDPERAALIREKVCADAKDGLTLSEINKWAKRQLSMHATRATAQCKYMEYLDAINEALRPTAKYALMKDSKENPVPYTSLTTTQIRRHQDHLRALRIVYLARCQELKAGTLYTHLTAACAKAAEFLGVTGRTVQPSTSGVAPTASP